MKYCTKCGAPNDDNALFCKQCGSPLASPAPAGPVQQTANPQAPPAQSPPGAQGGQPQQQVPPSGGYQQPQPLYQQYGQSQGSQVSSFLTPDNTILIALIFSGISVLVFFIETIITISSLVSLSAYISTIGPSYAYLYSGAIAGFYADIFIYLVVFVIGIFVLLRTWRIYNLIKQKRSQEAYQLDTLLWGVLGIIFGLIVTGVFLILLRGQLESALGMRRTF